MNETERAPVIPAGLLSGRKALIFGVANDHSIAWGIAKALHAAGADVGFSSIEALIEKRVQPLADSIGSKFVEPCDVQNDADIERVFARWQREQGTLDILVHALAFARREELDGTFCRHLARRFRARARRQRVFAGRSRPSRGSIDD